MYFFWSTQASRNAPSKDEWKQYTPVQTSDERGEVSIAGQSQERREWINRHVFSTLLVSSMIACAIGFLFGHYSRSSPENGRKGLLFATGNVIYPMKYNRTFSSEPSPKTDAAWASIFPPGLGFVKHPQLSPNLSGVAVFHELHCVNMLRLGYYAALNSDSAKEIEHTDDHDKRPDPHHLRHCFDYLRQSLMCNADTNLEPVDVELGGVTGWHFERTCRDYTKVKDWAEEWRNWHTKIDVPEHQQEHSKG